MAKLTEKQKRFADYYIETGNATESAKRAGYSPKTARVIGQENLLKPAIKSYIDERLKEMDEKRIMKAEEVMQLLTAIARNEVTEDVVVFNEGMTAIEQKGMSAKDRLKALELIGKRYAMWTEKQQVENITPVFLEDVPEDDN
ncbi:terminase small subunit [Caldifermentibacillus hisashii]|uniref:terminase small subunit n=1 Tax=Caldifermentibacillus hisashii TaxID=996558 RepID=UPI0031FCAAAD